MPPKETPLTQEQSNEFEFARLGYYCRVDTVWNNTRKKNDWKFSITKEEDGKEVIIQAGKKLFQCNEIEAIKERDKIITFYLNKLKNN
jgi:hypothetical protein